MASIWLIDGYNFIRCSRRFDEWEAEDPEAGKAAALEWLGEFSQGTGEELWVVLDHYSSLERERREFGAYGLKVLLSRGAYTADEEILTLTEDLGERAIVVSSDREVQQGALRRGACILSSQEFEREVAKVLRRLRGDEEEDFSEFESRGAPFKVPKEKKKAYAKLRKYQ